MHNTIDYNVNGIFRDTGEGDVDFFTYWYSVCYVVGMLNKYRSIFRDIEQYDEMMRRFLVSKGIAIKNDSVTKELVYLFNNWESCLAKRGTISINESYKDSNEIGLVSTTNLQFPSVELDIESNNGLGIISNTIDLVGTINSTVDLGYNHTIQFDLILSDNSGNQFNVDGRLLHSSNNSIYLAIVAPVDENNMSSYIFTYTAGGVSVNFDVSLDISTIQRIKFIRIQSKVFLLINEILIGTQVLSGSFEYTFDMLFTDLLPAIANIFLVKKNDSFESLDSFSWLCNEGSGFTLECNKSSLYYAVLNISSENNWNDVWFRDSRFNNNNFVGIDGELKRLLNYDRGEHLCELIATSEFGLCIDNSSFLSEEANCKNLNKAYEKGEIIKLSKFPLTFTDSLKPYIDSGYITYDLPSDNETKVGINTTLVNWDSAVAIEGIKPKGLIPFIPIPIATEGDNFEDYEISFVLNTTSSVSLEFGVIVYDKYFSRIPDHINKYETDSASDQFLNVSDFSLATDTDLWVRGILSVNKSNIVDNRLNINTGDNLYIDGNTEIRFMVPVISILNVDEDVTVKIKDIVIRPASLNTSKGVVSNKNKIIAYLKNNSGRSESNITDFIEQKLIPYNTTINIQYL